MKPRRKPVVGETLYSLNIGNAARRTEQKLTPLVVTKCGSKYFTLGEGWQATQFHIETWRQKTEYSAEQAIYESPQEWEDENEANNLRERFRKAFDHWNPGPNLSLNQLRRIAEIMNETGA